MASDPKAGQTFFSDEGEEYEIAEVLHQEEGTENWRVTDEDGDEAVIVWSVLNERWEII